MMIINIKSEKQAKIETRVISARLFSLFCSFCIQWLVILNIDLGFFFFGSDSRSFDLIIALEILQNQKKNNRIVFIFKKKILSLSVLTH